MTNPSHWAYIGPDQAQVDELRDLLDAMDSTLSSNDQRARYLLGSNFIRDNGATAAERVRRQDALYAPPSLGCEDAAPADGEAGPAPEAGSVPSPQPSPSSRTAGEMPGFRHPLYISP